MAENVARFMLLFVLALLVGTMFGIWVGFNPAALSATAYVEQQQNAIRSLNTLLPAMGAGCIVLAAMLAWLSKNNSRARCPGHPPWQPTHQCHCHHLERPVSTIRVAPTS